MIDGIGSVVFDGWEIIKEIGHGAYGHVYEIRKSEYGITAASALKVVRIPSSQNEVDSALSDGMDIQSVANYFKGFVDELAGEIAVMTRLQGHPNIVSYQDHHIDEVSDGIGWEILIRMELLELLVKYQLHNPDISEDLVIKLGIDIANALCVCQKNGIIHRDIKPDNIFWDKTSEAFKLGDFGVARALEKTTGGLSKKGTESYMAPEVYKGKAYGKTVDIYSLGILLYRCANRNRLPFYPITGNMVNYEQRESAMIRRMSGEPIPAPCAASPELAAIILKACEYEPENRYQNAVEMKAALEHLQLKKKSASKETGSADAERLNSKRTSQISSELTVGIDEERGRVRSEESIKETIGVYDNRNEETVGLNNESIQSAADRDQEQKKDKSGDHGKKESGKNTPEYDFTLDTNRKKNTPVIIGALAALGIVAALIIYALLPKAKTVTVVDGSGSGEYKSGETVSITAEQKEGYDFTGWTVKQGEITLTDAEAEETSFVMGKEAVEITASYAEKAYLLTVEGGVIQGTEESNGNFHEGDRITVEPIKKDDYTFNGWKVSDDMVVVQKTGNTLVFNMPSQEFSVTAEYEEKTYGLTIENGSIEGGGNTGNYAKGDKISIQASEKDGYDFAGWEVSEGDIQIADTGAKKTTVVMGTEDAEVKAVYTKRLKVGSIVTFGSYEQDNNTSNGKEDIEWIVLAEEDNQILVISRYGLDLQQYNTKWASVTWETCTLRTWLNTEFINKAFSDTELIKIGKKTVTNDDNYKYGTEGGRDTQDQIFLLSIEEANRYFVDDESRVCKPTEYAKARGLATYRNWWWLRSTGNEKHLAATVHSDGDINIAGISADIAGGSVRPALWIDLGS